MFKHEEISQVRDPSRATYTNFQVFQTTTRTDGEKREYFSLKFNKEYPGSQCMPVRGGAYNESGDSVKNIPPAITFRQHVSD